MRPILFTIPLPEWVQWLQSFQSLWTPLEQIPVYGYGFMLFIAFLAVNFTAKRMCQHERIEPKLILDMLIWMFATGIAGARAVYVIQYWHEAGFDHRPWVDVLKLQDGGLVFYGSMISGVAGYFVYWWYFLRPHHVSNWKMLDVVAPCIAIGLALGRIGCLFTGCCYGNVACAECPSIQFPITSTPSLEMIKRGMQTQLGFVLKDDSLEVAGVEPGSAAERAGVQAGDVLAVVNAVPVLTQRGLREAFASKREGRQDEVKLSVLRSEVSVELPPFVPTSIGLNPTQIYESISMSLLLFFLLSYYPYKRHDGELMVFVMFGYGIHRFLNEMLRTDTEPVWGTGLTLSQNISLLVLALGVVLAIAVWRRPATSPGG